MTDTRISEAPQAKQAGVPRPALWLMLAVSAAGNLVTQSMHLSMLVSIGFGLLTLVFGAALIAGHRRRR